MVGAGVAPAGSLAGVPVPLPDAVSRWRCSVCGNLTRFDVIRTTRTRDYVHVDLSGEPTVEEREVLDDEALTVTCRWCGSVDRVVLVPRPGSPMDAAG